MMEFKTQWSKGGLIADVMTSFDRIISNALTEGWQLHGSPSFVFNSGVYIMTQSMTRTPEQKMLGKLTS